MTVTHGGRQFRLEDLVGPIEIAERLGVERGVVRVWRHRGLMPEPLLVISNVPLWDWPTVLAWATGTGRAPVTP